MRTRLDWTFHTFRNFWDSCWSIWWVSSWEAPASKQAFQSRNPIMATYCEWHSHVWNVFATFPNIYWITFVNHIIPLPTDSDIIPLTSKDNHWDRDPNCRFRKSCLSMEAIGPAPHRDLWGCGNVTNSAKRLRTCAAHDLHNLQLLVSWIYWCKGSQRHMNDKPEMTTMW